MLNHHKSKKGNRTGESAQEFLQPCWGTWKSGHHPIKQTVFTEAGQDADGTLIVIFLSSILWGRIKPCKYSNKFSRLKNNEQTHSRVGGQVCVPPASFEISTSVPPEGAHTASLRKLCETKVKVKTMKTYFKRKERENKPKRENYKITGGKIQCCKILPEYPPKET